jgi:NADP-dependent 3-hydroxy acid dehydrogenase YdfG
LMAVNVGGVFYGCRAAMPHLIRSKGCIVNTASLSGLGGDWGMCIYDTSKGAVVNLTRALASIFPNFLTVAWMSRLIFSCFATSHTRTNVLSAGIAAATL